jgi:hypothetical protein
VESRHDEISYSVLLLAEPQRRCIAIFGSGNGIFFSDGAGFRRTGDAERSA